MFDLRIARGARLLATPPDSTNGVPAEAAPGARHVDVTRDAVAYLFDSVRLEEGVTLADVLGLLNACPVLRHVFERDFAHEYAEALAAAVAGTPGSLPAADRGLKRVEVYPVRHFNTAQRAEESQSWHFHGVGPAPAQSHRQATLGSPDSDDVNWSLSLCELEPLLALPLTISTEAAECEADAHSLQFGATLRSYSVAAPTLGELLRAVLYELSFHGGPAQRAQAHSQIMGLADEALKGAPNDDAHTGDEISTEGQADSWTVWTRLLTDSDRQAMGRLFALGHPAGDDALAQVVSIVRNIPDAELACTALAAQAPGWVLREAFRRLNGRDLREAAFTAGQPGPELADSP